MHIGRVPVRNCPKMSVRIKINEDGYEALNEVFTNQKECGPFVKSPDNNDLVKALKLMEIGKENGSTKFTKPILFNIIKALLIQQKWAEKVEGEDDKIEEVNDSDENKGDETENGEKDQNDEKSKSVKEPLNANNERKNLHSNVCKFYKLAKCKYGMTGKNKDWRGNICQYDHPPICQEYRKFERNREKGCRGKECDKLHYNFCKLYRDCKDMDNCGFYHPKRKQTKPMPSFQPRDESRPRREYERSSWESSEKMNFLGQRYPPQVTSQVWENRAHQYQQPLPGPENMREERMRDLLTNMEKLFHQAKSIMQ